MMKIKVKPEDFIVEEIADIPITHHGNFSVYLLKKKGWNTVDAIQRLSRQYHIPSSDFSYGGKKDKYALTSQYITIAEHHYQQNERGSNPPRSPFKKEGLSRINKGNLHEICEDYSISFIGLMDRPMGPDLIQGNKFTITVRNLTEDELRLALSEVDHVKKYGYPNYFDDQRFGSFDPRQGFIAEKILKKHYNGALKIYFTHIRPENSKEEKEHKRLLSENWGNWQLCLETAKSRFEKETFGHLKDNPKDFITILQKISHEEMSLFFSAYQSYLWNELLRRIIQILGKDTLKDYQGIAGDYLFSIHLNDEHNEYVKKLTIPTPAANIRMPDTLTETLYSKVLQDNSLRPSMFNIRKIRQAFFKGTERSAMVTPENLFVDHSADDVYPGKKKLILKFSLPRGCFGTMLIKRLFCL